MSTCEHWHDCGVINGGCCTHPPAQREFGKTINLKICEICPYYEGPSRGLGDDIHNLAKKTGVNKFMKAVKQVTGKDCGCGGRRRELNQRYGKKNK